MRLLQSVKSGFARGIEKLQSWVGKPWYVALVALLAAADSFLLIFPIDFFWITRLVFRREGWLKNALIIATGSALGSLALAAMVHYHLHFIDHPTPTSVGGHEPTHIWHQASRLVHEYSAVGVGIVAVSPIPLPFAVVVAAWDKVPLAFIFLAAWLGRAVKYAAYGFLGVYFPQTLRRFLKSPPERNPNPATDE